MDMLTTLHTSAHQLGAIPDGTVQAVITSPPYYGLRSYAGEQDVEWPTVTYRLNEFTEPVTVQGCEAGCEHEWVEHQGKVQSGGIGTGVVGSHQDDRTHFSATSRYCLHCGGWRGPLGLEPSPVAYIGHLILCLREWGRVLRDDGTVWVNLGDSYASQPSWGRGGGSTLDGRKQGNEGGASIDRGSIGLKPKDLLGIPWMFAFAARADGWWLRSDIIWAKPNPMPESVTDRPTKAHEYVFMLAKSARYYFDADAVREANVTEGDRREGNGRFSYNGKFDGEQDDKTQRAFVTINPAGRNIRTVWNIATSPYPGAHYAVFPERLVAPMVKAGSKPGDVVLDPFAGSGTTGRVAIKLGRRAILCDVSAEYLTDHVPDRTTVQMELLA